MCYLELINIDSYRYSTNTCPWTHATGSVCLSQSGLDCSSATRISVHGTFLQLTIHGVFGKKRKCLPWIGPRKVSGNATSKAYIYRNQLANRMGYRLRECYRSGLSWIVPAFPCTYCWLLAPAHSLCGASPTCVRFDSLSVSVAKCTTLYMNCSIGSVIYSTKTSKIIIMYCSLLPLIVWGLELTKPFVHSSFASIYLQLSW